MSVDDKPLEKCCLCLFHAEFVYDCGVGLIIQNHHETVLLKDGKFSSIEGAATKMLFLQDMNTRAILKNGVVEIQHNIGYYVGEKLINLPDFGESTISCDSGDMLIWYNRSQTSCNRDVQLTGGSNPNLQYLPTKHIKLNRRLFLSGNVMTDRDVDKFNSISKNTHYKETGADSTDNVSVLFGANQINTPPLDVTQVLLDGIEFSVTEPVSTSIKLANAADLQEIKFVTKAQTTVSVTRSSLQTILEKVATKLVTFRCKSCAAKLASSQSLVRHEKVEFVDPVECPPGTRFCKLPTTIIFTEPITKYDL
ncbi:hypothetical protein FF38_06115 [Lucilia cuprina]|uniref:C2H2-type domain-containing protein n=1 Tax=Lucilia cuprina TaxID=7375 RepID=A0A0L0C6H0_LUCCU|nr:hypothetical protein FF38_06115 [Lucilia cuprina]